MKLSSRDLRALQQAARIADAQRELMKARSENHLSRYESGAIATALVCLVLLTLAGLTETMVLDEAAQHAAPQQYVAADQIRPTITR
jgi:hypothetical protein